MLQCDDGYDVQRRPLFLSLPHRGASVVDGGAAAGGHYQAGPAALRRPAHGGCRLRRLGVAALMPTSHVFSRRSLSIGSPLVDGLPLSRIRSGDERLAPQALDAGWNTMMRRMCRTILSGCWARGSRLSANGESPPSECKLQMARRSAAQDEDLNSWRTQLGLVPPATPSPPPGICRKSRPPRR